MPKRYHWFTVLNSFKTSCGSMILSALKVNRQVYVRGCRCCTLTHPQAYPRPKRQAWYIVTVCTCANYMYSVTSILLKSFVHLPCLRSVCRRFNHKKSWLVATETLIHGLVVALSWTRLAFTSETVHDKAIASSKSPGEAAYCNLSLLFQSISATQSASEYNTLL